MTPEQAAALRAPFPASAIGKLPRGNTQLDYVGHAAVTDRLLSVDPEWNWWPIATAENGTPLWHADGETAVMWIQLRVCGVIRYGVGICSLKAFELEKQLISDAIRNAAMRFGVALDLWSKEDLSGAEDAGRELGRAPAASESVGDGRPPSRPRPTPMVPEAPKKERGTHPASANKRAQLRSRTSALVAAKISVATEREALGLPTIDNSDADDLERWDVLLSRLEAQLPAAP